MQKKLSTQQCLYLLIASFAVGWLIYMIAYLGMLNESGAYQLNQPILNWMITIRSPWLTGAAKLITAIADTPTILVVLLAAFIAWVTAKRELWRPFLLIVAAILAFGTSYLMKVKTINPRPPILDMIPPFEFSYSFPSGHTIIITTIILVLGYLIYSRNFSRQMIYFWSIATVIGSATIALSRLYLGYHWFTDVLGSVGLSFIILAVVILFDRVALDYFGVKEDF